MDRPLKWDPQGTEMVGVDVGIYEDIYVNEIERKAGKIDRKAGEGHLTH